MSTVDASSVLHQLLLGRARAASLLAATESTPAPERAPPRYTPAPTKALPVLPPRPLLLAGWWYGIANRALRDNFIAEWHIAIQLARGFARDRAARRLTAELPTAAPAA